ncbi:MAG: hypothetical protein IIW85_03360 [Bacteroidaceae bacterium]|jgi:predicted  nucleic acid-binding Zn-ribbon protein|nr:hypothetical protein [Bacteroidaceae bacterium]MBR5530505.1 hypothetical protein [Bacteroidaceae bacterium]
MATKKENPADMSVEKRLETLYQLQTMLSEIDKIKTLRGELPLEVQDLEDEIEGLQHRLDKYAEEVAALSADIAKKREIINTANEAISRYEKQLDEVRNNREYDLLKKEIEFQSLEVELQKKRIGQATAAIEAKKADIANGETALKERRLDLDVKKSELGEIIAETKAEEEKLMEKAKHLELSIEPRLLAAFKRIRKSSRNGLGIVYVQRDACGGCFNKIPPQRQLDIRMRKKIIVCEYCGRIMIDPELAGVKIEKPAEEKPKRRIRRAAAAPKAEAPAVPEAE